MGFNHLIGNKDPFFKNAPRYVFNAVFDDMLFKRLIKFVKEAPKENYFAFVETVSMHGHYYDPRTKTHSFDETVKTFDINFTNFMRDLDQTDFFKNGGLLVVTGDHRVMGTMSAEEIREMGFFAPQSVPLVIFGDLPYKINRNKHFSHVDLHYSLQYLLMKEPERHQYQRNIFSHEPDREFFCSFYQQLVDTSVVLFNTTDKAGKIRLNGDKTEIICPELTAEEEKKVESFLVWMRTR